MTTTTNIIDIFLEEGQLIYAYESDQEYRTIEADDLMIARAIGLDVEYSEKFDEYYYDGILDEYYEFSKEELIQFLNTLPEESPVTETRRSVMTEAWTMFKSGLFKSFGIALKSAWNKIKLSKRLSSGIAYFSFKKIDGSIREAIGTLRQGNFNYTYKGNKRNNAATLSYWDVQKRAWRSCRLDQIIAIQ